MLDAARHAASAPRRSAAARDAVVRREAEDRNARVCQAITAGAMSW